MNLSEDELKKVKYFFAIDESALLAFSAFVFPASFNFNPKNFLPLDHHEPLAWIGTGVSNHEEMVDAILKLDPQSGIKLLQALQSLILLHLDGCEKPWKAIP
jgi:hypothetical protein